MLYCMLLFNYRCVYCGGVDDWKCVGDAPQLPAQRNPPVSEAAKALCVATYKVLVFT